MRRILLAHTFLLLRSSKAGCMNVPCYLNAKRTSTILIILVVENVIERLINYGIC
jgi:hypothetical protein